MTPQVKGKLLKTAGLVVIGIGVYLIILGDEYDPDDAYFETRPPDDTIIDAEWYEVD